MLSATYSPTQHKSAKGYCAEITHQLQARGQNSPEQVRQRYLNQPVTRLPGKHLLFNGRGIREIAPNGLIGHC